MTSRLVIDDKARIGSWVAQQVGHTASWGSFYSMGIEQDGEIISGVVVHDFNGVNAVCHIAVKKTGKSLFKLLRATADYAFRQCKLKRLTGMVPASKPDVLAFESFADRQKWHWIIGVLS